MDDVVEHTYDATKRREYYLKNRKLKGRKNGSVRTIVPKKTRAQLQAERRKRQEVQIAALKGRLEKLREVLSAETKKAQARSGADTTKTASTTVTTSSSSSSQKLTASQKAKKAAAEKKAREKNQTLDEQVQSLLKKIKSIQARIVKMRKDGSA